MNKTIKRISIILLSFILISCIKVNAAEDTISVTINPSQTQILEGSSLDVKINIEDQVQPSSVVVIEFYYSKDIFEEASDEDFQKVGRWNYPEIGLIEDVENSDSYYYYRAMVDRTSDVTTIGTILDFSLKVKDEIANLNSACIGVSFVELSDNSATSITREEKNVIYRFTNVESLYLDTSAYKIGTNETKTYENGDKYITRISPNTTRKQFLSNLQTNGEITVYDLDGTEQQDEIDDNELIKTGMKLKVSKEECEDIDLTLVVIGDTSKDGQVTATDMSDLTQIILKEAEPEEMIILAADISDDQKVTATDMADMIQILLKELTV